jgi:hypothetical protein
MLSEVPQARWRPLSVDNLTASVAVAVVCGPLWLLPRHGAANTSSLPTKLEVGLLLKAIAYDNNFSSRYSGVISIVVVSRDGDEWSREAAARVINAIRKEEGFTIRDRSVSVTDLPMLNAGQLGGLLSKREIKVIYLCPHLEDLLSDILALADKHDAVTATGVRSYVVGGAAVAAVLHHGRPRMIVNIQGAKKQGVEFQSTFLKLAEVVGDGSTGN